VPWRERATSDRGSDGARIVSFFGSTGISFKHLAGDLLAGSRGQIVEVGVFGGPTFPGSTTIVRAASLALLVIVLASNGLDLGIILLRALGKGVVGGATPMTRLAFAETGSTGGGFRRRRRRLSRRTFGSVVPGERLFSLACIRVGQEGLPDLTSNKTLGGNNSIFGVSSVAQDDGQSSTLGAAIEGDRIHIRRVQLLKDGLNIVVKIAHEERAKIDGIHSLASEWLRSSLENRMKLSYWKNLDVTLSINGDLADTFDRGVRLG
jgi:hypothetical protein